MLINLCHTNTKSLKSLCYIETPATLAKDVDCQCLTQVLQLQGVWAVNYWPESFKLLTQTLPYIMDLYVSDGFKHYN